MLRTPYLFPERLCTSNREIERMMPFFHAILSAFGVPVSGFLGYY
jgi:hypothetical protein